MPDAEAMLRSAYRAFNARDMEGALAQMHADVDWPNAWEGGRVRGRDAVREYWRRQFATVSTQAEPERFTAEPDGSVIVHVHQIVHDEASGLMLTDTRVRHRYALQDSLVVRMDVLPGRDNAFQVTPTEVGGPYKGKCYELCGTYHSRMLFQVEIVSQEEYDEYVADLQDDPDHSSDKPVTGGSYADVPYLNGDEIEGDHE